MTPRQLAPLIALALGSCSYTYDVRAVMIDGRLAFVADRSWLGQPDCFRSIEVRSRAEPSRALWRQAAPASSCPFDFPVFYGDRLIADVLVEPLRAGTIYEVASMSRGSGYGRGRFRLTGDRRVENLP